jgi:hypothetical protein
VVRKSEKSVSLSIDENSIFLMKIVIVVYYAQDIGLF